MPGGLKESRGREPRKSEEGGCAVATRLTMREDSEGKKVWASRRKRGASRGGSRRRVAVSERQDGGQELGLGASRLDARLQKGPDGPRSGTSDAAFGVPHRGGDASVVCNPLHRTPVSALQHATLRSPARHGCESVFAETPSAVPRPTANSQLFSHRRVDYHIDVTISPVCKCLDIQIVPTCY